MQKNKILIAAGFLLFLASCKKQQHESAKPETISKSAPRTGNAIPLTKEEYNKLPRYDKLNAGRTTSCPSADLTAQFPAPADQGFQFSNPAFTFGYYIKSYWEAREHSWSFTNNHLTSPQYIYSQTHASNAAGGGGTTISAVLNLLVSQGASTIDISPYDPNNAFGFVPQPTEPERIQAYRYRDHSWGTVAYSDPVTIKDLLCGGVPVGLLLPVYPDFQNLDASNEVYNDVSGTFSGYQTVAIIGFDDTRNAFKFINSWGTNWGVNGYGWISYDLLTNINIYFEAYATFDLYDPSIAEAWNSTSNAGIGTLGYYTGDVNGDGNTDVIHPWNNNGTLAILAHDITATPTSYLVNQTMSGAGSNNVGFVPADVNGDGKTDLVQGWKNGNNLALTVFTSNGTSFSRTWDGTTASGYQNLRLLPVDYDGDGKTDIAHLWNNNGSLGIIIYRSNGSSYSLVASTTVASGAGNIGFIPADYDGDGKTDIVQFWNNNGNLGIVVMRSNGSNYSLVWSTTTIYTSATVGIIPVDYNGDGKMDFINAWNDLGSLRFHLYRSTGSSYVLQEYIQTRQGYQNLGLLPQKRAGDPKTGLVQVWNNNQKTAFIRYDAITY